VIRATEPYHVADEIAPYVSLVEGLVRFPKFEFKPTRIGEAYRPPAFEGLEGSEFDSCGSSCSGFTTPDVLAAAYGFTPVAAADVTDGNRMAVAEFQNQYVEFYARKLVPAPS
jgi:hypothetical protein